MAAFTPSFTVSLNAAGTLLTLTDTSNYDTNDELYTREDFVTRIFTITDPYGEEVLNTPATIVDDIAEITLDKDRAITIVITLSTDTDVTYSETTTYLAINQVMLSFISKMNLFDTCTCDNEKQCSNQRKINNEITAAKYNFTFGDLVNSQRHLDYANELTSKDCNC